MSKPFKALLEKMSPERRARIQAKTELMEENLMNPTDETVAAEAIALLRAAPPRQMIDDQRS